MCRQCNEYVHKRTGTVYTVMYAIACTGGVARLRHFISGMQVRKRIFPSICMCSQVYEVVVAICKCSKVMPEKVHVACTVAPLKLIRPDFLRPKALTAEHWIVTLQTVPDKESQ